MTKLLLLPLPLVASAACRPSPEAQETEVARRAPAVPAENGPQAPAAEDDHGVFDQPFVFTIDGMRKFNGAL